MKKVLALYFSGTGNTRYAVKKLCEQFSDKGVDCQIVNIEEYTSSAVTGADTIIIGYPIYGSCIPKPMKEFLLNHLQLFTDKNLITVITQFLASGDGGALAARLLKKHKIEFKHLTSLHINMPSNICDFRLLKVKNGTEIAKKIKKADKKIIASADKILKCKSIRNGRGLFSRAIGFFSQRMYYPLVEKKFIRTFKIDEINCIVCSKCVNCCPTKNLILTDGKISQQDNCAVCYRCVNICPKKVIKIVGKKFPTEQYKGIDS